MLILGINSQSHDASAALVQDGKLLFAVEEERFNGEKHTMKFPIHSVQSCLDFAQAKIEDIDAICAPFIYPKQVKERYLKYWLKQFPKANERMMEEVFYIKEKLFAPDEIRKQLNFKKEIYSCRHHVAHMASAYFLSKFKKSALMSIDGLGEIESVMVGRAEENQINTFDEYSVNWPDSIGSLYGACTRYLGFKANCDEGKVMGLAPYGDPETYSKIFEDIVHFKEGGTFEFDLGYLKYPFKTNSHFSEKFISICGGPREDRSEITQRHKDIAASLQQVTEKAILHIASHLYKVTGLNNLCLAGGVALNCVANGRVLSETPFEKIFIQPAANDAGAAAGAALHYYYLKNTDGRRYFLNHSYLGTSHSDKKIENLLEKRGVKFNKDNNLYAKVAGLLSQGKIIAWFCGRMEFGPRSLGNRSILTAPFPAEMKNILNSKVKKRESFRPYAPAVLVEDLEDYFDSSHESPFMLLTYNVKKSKISKVPAITHVDGTARVQTVDKFQNPDFYKLISEFKRITGIGVLLNTSFNIMGQPIVEKPEDAIDCFLSTGIDYLVFNAKYLIEK